MYISQEIEEIVFEIVNEIPKEMVRHDTVGLIIPRIYEQRSVNGLETGNLPFSVSKDILVFVIYDNNMNVRTVVSGIEVQNRLNAKKENASRA